MPRALSKLRWTIGFRMNGDEACLRTPWQPVYRRHDLNTGFSTERENLVPDVKGNDKWLSTTRKNTDAGARDGAASSSDEAPVMGVERRGGVIQPIRFVNLRG